jgi:transcriptional regulator GlxA family with amidase domain
MRTSANAGIILTIFRDTGAAHFFSEPLHEFFGTTTALEDLAPRSEVERTAELVAESPDLPARIAVVERFLLARAGRRRGDALVAAAVEALRAARGSVRIAELAKGLRISQDRLEKRFRWAVGSSPKKFASLLRVRRAIAAHHPGASLSELALEAGYFDQAHFSRDFRAVTGQAPQQFFRAGEHC